MEQINPRGSKLVQKGSIYSKLFLCEFAGIKNRGGWVSLLPFQKKIKISCFSSKSKPTLISGLSPGFNIKLNPKGLKPFKVVRQKKAITHRKEMLLSSYS